MASGSGEKQRSAKSWVGSARSDIFASGMATTASSHPSYLTATMSSSGGQTSSVRATLNFSAECTHSYLITCSRCEAAANAMAGAMNPYACVRPHEGGLTVGNVV